MARPRADTRRPRRRRPQATGSGPGHLAAGSIAAALPTNILIADRNNNRVLVDLTARARSSGHRRRALAERRLPQHDRSHGRRDPASAVGGLLARRRQRHGSTTSTGTRNTPGSGDDHLRDPQTAQETSTGEIVIADLGNCRHPVRGTQPPHVPAVATWGKAVDCVPSGHPPPYASPIPDAAVPTARRRASSSPSGTPPGSTSSARPARWSRPTQLRDFSQPYDANEYAPGQLIVTDRTHPGKVEEFNFHGQRDAGADLDLRRRPRAPASSTARRWRSCCRTATCSSPTRGNDRVIVIDPTPRSKIVWQYGHTAHAGHTPGLPAHARQRRSAAVARRRRQSAVRRRLRPRRT